jgi:hypothetical protein
LQSKRVKEEINVYFSWRAKRRIRQNSGVGVQLKMGEKRKHDLGKDGWEELDQI